VFLSSVKDSSMAKHIREPPGSSREQESVSLLSAKPTSREDPGHSEMHSVVPGLSS